MPFKPPPADPLVFKHAHRECCIVCQCYAYTINSQGAEGGGGGGGGGGGLCCCLRCSSFYANGRLQTH